MKKMLIRVYIFIVDKIDITDKNQFIDYPDNYHIDKKVKAILYICGINQSPNEFQFF